jgi:SAM-dependent methyltransferase
VSFRVAPGHLASTECGHTTAHGSASSRVALAETIDVYDSEADEFAKKLVEGDFQSLRARFLLRLPSPSKPIVDAGCGSGRDVGGFVSVGVQTIGVDLSRAMLARAKVAVPSALASWLHADIRAIPLPAGSSGGVWTNATLLHLDLPGQSAAIHEFRRIVSPGCPLFISTLPGIGVSHRESVGARKRWFWGSDVASLSKTLHDAGFEVLSIGIEPGVVRGEWLNALALAV